jgi:hypothetical protein
MRIALLHQVVNIHLELVSQVLEGAELFGAGRLRCGLKIGMAGAWLQYGSRACSTMCPAWAIGLSLAERLAELDSKWCNPLVRRRGAPVNYALNLASCSGVGRRPCASRDARSTGTTTLSSYILVTE